MNGLILGAPPPPDGGKWGQRPRFRFLGVRFHEVTNFAPFRVALKPLIRHNSDARKLPLQSARTVSPKRRTQILFRERKLLSRNGLPARSSLRAAVIYGVPRALNWLPHMGIRIGTEVFDPVLPVLPSANSVPARRSPAPFHACILRSRLRVAHVCRLWK